MPHWTESVRRLQQIKADIPKIVGNEMVNYALTNIRLQKDIHGKPLKKRKPGAERDSGRAILVDRGHGRRSIDDKVEGDIVKLTALDYMVAHNEGASMRGTRNVRAHTRKRAGRSESVKSHTRKVDYDLPVRQISGKSDAQTKQINQVIANRIVKALT